MKFWLKVHLVPIVLLSLGLVSGCKSNKESSQVNQKNQNVQAPLFSPKPNGDTNTRLLFASMNRPLITTKNCEEYFGKGGPYEKVKTILLENTKIDVKCFGHFPTTLSELHLSNLKLGDSNEKDDWFQLFEEIGNKLPNLTVLSIENAVIGKESPKQITKKLKALEKLRLINVGLNLNGVTEIARGLRKLTFLDVSTKKLSTFDLREKNLHSFELYNEIDSKGIQEIAQNLENLAVLILTGNKIGLEDVKELVTGKLEHLTHLALSGNDINAPVLEKLKELKNLTALTLEDCTLDTIEIEQLARRNPTNLTSLALKAVKINLSGLKSIANLLTSLTHLSLESLYLNNKELEALGQGNLTNLTHLVLKRTTSPRKQTGSFAHGNLKNLTYLLVDEVGLTPDHFKEISENLTNLTTLAIGEASDLNSDKMRALASGNLKNLTALAILGGRDFDSDGVKALTSGNFSNLTHLFLDGTKIGNEGAKTLAQRGNLTKLTHLYLIDESMSKDEARALAQQKFTEQVITTDLSNAEVFEVFAWSYRTGNLGKTFFNFSPELLP